MIRPSIKMLAAGSTALTMLAGGPALAQMAPGGPAGPVTTQDASRLDDIIITARRRDESAQDVPIALSVIGSEQLENTGAYNLGQLTQMAPSVQLLSSNPRNTAVTIRGLGASYGLANDGLEQGVGIYIDQVYYGRPSTATLDFIDLERIEILRGPQGTLFGKNTTAGALNIITRVPSFTPEGQTEVSVGDHGFLQAKASVSGPLIADTLAGRLSFVSTRREGMVDNVTTGEDQNAQSSVGLRAQLLYDRGGVLTARLYADWSDQEPECCTQVYFGYGPTLRSAAQQYPALAAGRGYAPPSTNPYDRLADVDSPIAAGQTHRGLSAIVDYDLGWASLTSITAWRDWDWRPQNDRDYTALDIVRQSANPSRQDQWSQELRLASTGEGRLDWVAGLYAFHQAVETTGVTEYGADASYWLLAAGTPDALLDGYTIFNDSRIETESHAVFGQATWRFTDRLRTTLGLRYTSEDKQGRYDATTAGGLVTADPTLISRRLGVARPQSYEAAISGEDLSGQLAVSYDLGERIMLYGTAARGYKSGGINMAGIPTLPDGSPALASIEVDPEAVTTFELGLKTQSFNRHLTANLALYSTDITDYQANVVDAGPGALRGYLANVDKVEIRGVELDLTARPTASLDLYANVAWTDAEYADFPNGPCPLERIGPSTAACDLSGETLPGVSPWALSAGGERRARAGLLGLNGEVALGADLSYRSSYYSDASASRYLEIEGYALLNLRLSFRADNGWEAVVWAKNALDQDYMSFLSVQSGNSGLIIGQPGDPRTVGLTLRNRF